MASAGDYKRTTEGRSGSSASRNPNPEQPLPTVRVVACSRTYNIPRTAYIVLLKYDEDPASPEADYHRAGVADLADGLANAAWINGGVSAIEDLLALPAPYAGDKGPTWAEHLRRQDAALGLRGTLRAVLHVTREDGTDAAPTTSDVGMIDATVSPSVYSKGALVAAHAEIENLRGTIVWAKDHLRDLSSTVLGHSGDGAGRTLEWQVGYLERWLAPTIREREERAAAVALAGKPPPPPPADEVSRLTRENLNLRDQLSREAASAQAANAIADELSVALEKSRALVDDCDAHLLAIREALGCDDGAITIVAEVARLRAEHADLAMRLQNHAFASAKIEADLREQLRNAHSTADDRRDRMADPEGMASGWSGLPQPTRAEQGFDE